MFLQKNFIICNLTNLSGQHGQIRNVCHYCLIIFLNIITVFNIVQTRILLAFQMKSAKHDPSTFLR